MKKKKLLMLIGSICLTLVLAALLLPACAPVEVPEEIAKLEAEIADLEGDVAAEKTKTAAEKAKVSDLEKEIAALKKPVEVQEWEPASWSGSGAYWNGLVFLCDAITNMSDGRIVANPTLPGAVTPVKEQLDAVARGTTEAMSIYPGYWSGAIPVAVLWSHGANVAQDYIELQVLYETYEDGELLELFKEECAKFGNVVLVAPYYRLSANTLISTVPLDRLDDVKGLKIRSRADLAETLGNLGAGTVFLPGEEIYTALATGVIDAATWGSIDSNIALSLHEVTDYWVRTPNLTTATCESFVVNGTVWQELPDDLKAMIPVAVQAGNGVDTREVTGTIREGWKFLEDYGITFNHWPSEDVTAWKEALRGVLPEEPEDPATAEALDIITRFALEMGYWK